MRMRNRFAGYTRELPLPTSDKNGLSQFRRSPDGAQALDSFLPSLVDTGQRYLVLLL
jgi:hypothetical protein